MRLFIFGITDACILAVLFAAAERTGAALGNYLLWVVVPFAASCSLYMYLIRKIRNSTVNYVLVCAGTFLCGVCLYLHRYYDRMEYFLSGSAGTVAAAAVLVTTMAVLGTQVCAYVRFVSQKGKGWDEIWNYG